MIDFKAFRKDNKLGQKDIQDVLGCTQGYVSALETGRKHPTDEQIDLLKRAFGDIEKYILPINTKEITTNTTENKKKIPFYDDISSIGGNNGVSADIDNTSISEYIDAGDWFPEATAAIRHYGESMVEYPSGSILAIKRVMDDRLIIWGRNYVIETTEFRITKQLQDGGSDFILAYSSNHETYPDGRQIHSPIHIPKETIRSIDLVLGCVTKEYSNGAITILN